MISLYRFLFIKFCTGQDFPHNTSINVYLDDYFSEVLLKLRFKLVIDFVLSLKYQCHKLHSSDPKGTLSILFDTGVSNESDYCMGNTEIVCLQTCTPFPRVLWGHVTSPFWLWSLSPQKPLPFLSLHFSWWSPIPFQMISPVKYFKSATLIFLGLVLAVSSI